MDKGKGGLGIGDPTTTTTTMHSPPHPNTTLTPHTFSNKTKKGADYRKHHGSHRAEAADGAALVGKALKEKKEAGVWDAPSGPVWRFYDMDGAGAWGEAKLRAFLEVGVVGVVGVVGGAVGMEGRGAAVMDCLFACGPWRHFFVHTYTHVHAHVHACI